MKRLYKVAEREGFEPPVKSPSHFYSYNNHNYLIVNNLYFLLLVKFALLCLISVSVQSNKNN
jgi:hypothetical protein